MYKKELQFMWKVWKMLDIIVSILALIIGGAGVAFLFWYANVYRNDQGIKVGGRVAKYDWIALKKEYILGDYKSVSAFLKEKGIKATGNTNKQTKGWNNKKAEKEQKKGNKIIEKVIEKESEKEDQQIVDIRLIANELALDIIKAQKELNMHIARNKKKTKTVKYDYKTNKPSKETIDETEEVTSYMSIIDRQGLKQLTSALKDLHDIIPQEPEGDEDNSFIEALNEKTEVIWNEEE